MWKKFFLLFKLSTFFSESRSFENIYELSKFHFKN